MVIVVESGGVRVGWMGHRTGMVLLILAQLVYTVLGMVVEVHSLAWEACMGLALGKEWH